MSLNECLCYGVYFKEKPLQRLNQVLPPKHPLSINTENDNDIHQ